MQGQPNILHLSVGGVFLWYNTHMGKVLDIKEKISLEPEEVVNDLKETVTDLEEAEKYIDRLANSESFKNFVLEPLQMQVKKLSVIKLPEVDAHNSSLQKVSDKIARQAIFNQGKVDGLNELLDMFPKN